MLTGLFKNALVALMLEKTTKTIQKKRNPDKAEQRLLHPLKNWKNRDYVLLSVIANLDEHAVKRLFGYEPYRPISPKNQEKIAQFLGFGKNLLAFEHAVLAKMIETASEGNSKFAKELNFAKVAPYQDKFGKVKTLHKV